MSGDYRALYSQVERDGVPNQEAWSMSSLSGLSFDSSSGRAIAEKPRLIPEATVLNDANKLIANWKRNVTELLLLQVINCRLGGPEFMPKAVHVLDKVGLWQDWRREYPFLQ